LYLSNEDSVKLIVGWLIGSQPHREDSPTSRGPQWECDVPRRWQRAGI